VATRLIAKQKTNLFIERAIAQLEQARLMAQAETAAAVLGCFCGEADCLQREHAGDSADAGGLA
jgi:hypothetical protein